MNCNIEASYFLDTGISFEFDIFRSNLINLIILGGLIVHKIFFPAYKRFSKREKVVKIALLESMHAKEKLRWQLVEVFYRTFLYQDLKEISKELLRVRYSLKPDEDLYIRTTPNCVQYFSSRTKRFRFSVQSYEVISSSSLEKVTYTRFESFEQLWKVKVGNLPIKRSRILPKKRRFWNLFCLKFWRHCELMARLNSKSFQVVHNIGKFITGSFTKSFFTKLINDEYIDRACVEFDFVQDCREILEYEEIVITNEEDNPRIS